MPMSFVDNGIDLFFGKSWVGPQCSVGLEFIVRGGVELDPVRAIVDLFADGLACRPRAVHSLIIRWQAYLWRTENSLTCGHQPHGGHLHTRSLKKSPVNGSLDVHVGVAAPVAHQIAQGRESRAQILLGVGE